jgi:ankyrin repeat protein
MVSLLIKHGADVNKTNSQGEIPLHYAIRLGREDLVIILLKGGSNINLRGTKVIHIIS